MEFEMLDQETAGKTIIKVVGVGGAGGNAVPVSYTHLTLPTIYSV